MSTCQVRKNDFIRHIKQLNIGDQFATTDPDSDIHWHNIAVTAFRCSHPSSAGHKIVT